MYAVGCTRKLIWYCHFFFRCKGIKGKCLPAFLKLVSGSPLYPMEDSVCTENKRSNGIGRSARQQVTAPNTTLHHIRRQQNLLVFPYNLHKNKHNTYERIIRKQKSCSYRL